MDEHVQHEITLACIALLQKNAVDYQKESKGDILHAEEHQGLCYACAVDYQKESKDDDLHEPKTKREAIESLLKAANEPAITFGDVTDALWIVYKRSRPASQTRQWVTQLLLDLVRREDITASDAIEAARTLYSLSPQGTPEQQEAIQILLALAKRRDIPFNDTVEAAHALYVQSPKSSKERQQAIEMLLAQAHWLDTTVAQAQEAALALGYASPYPSKERNQASQALIELTRRPNLSFEDAVVLDNHRIIVASTGTLEKQQLAAKKQMWLTVTQRPDLTAEQRAQLAEVLEIYRRIP